MNMKKMMMAKDKMNTKKAIVIGNKLKRQWWPWTRWTHRRQWWLGIYKKPTKKMKIVDTIIIAMNIIITTIMKK
jgi:hypothetical protein